MSRIVRFAKWTKTNPKKSIFFGSVIAYGTDYGLEKRRIRLMMRAFCEEAETYGEKSCPANKVPRHVTVLLNKHAKGGKDLYEEYAAPLLHLSGAKVSLFKTEHAGQAKELMQIMDNTDAVLVVGGDGTLSEAVSGLLTRDDRLDAVKRFPIGIVPIGRTNTLANRLYFKEGMLHKELVAKATMAVIRDIRRPIDAYRVDFHDEKLWNRLDDANGELTRIQNEDLQKHGIPVEQVAESLQNSPVSPEFSSSIPSMYGVGKVECGVFRDIDALIDKYWYFGSLRARAAYFFRGLRSVPQAEETEIEYSDVCSGCNKCMKREITQPKVEPVQTTEARKKWWSSFEKKEPVKAKVDPYEKYATIVNENCGRLREASLHCTNMEVVPVNGALLLRASPDLSSVMSDGFERHSKQSTPSMKDQLEAGVLRFDFPMKDPVDPNYIPTPEEQRSKELLIKGKKMNIESEVFARQPISVTLFRNAVNFFVTS